MASLRTATALLAALLARVSSGAVWTAPSDFTCWDASTKHICLPAWQIGRGNATFTVVCTPPKGATLQWCGIGFNTVYPSPARWGMAQSEVIMLVARSDGSVSLEDRAAPQPGVPACFDRQATTLLSASVDGATGALTAHFTRPVFLSDELLSLGYTDLNRTVPTIPA